MSLVSGLSGTGITLYVAQDVGDIYNTTISLDGGPRTIHWAYSPPDSKDSRYNITLYDIQSLPDAAHTVNVKLVPGITRLLFDYAAVTGESASSAAVRQSARNMGLLGILGLILAIVMY